MKIKLKDGSIREFASGLTVKDILFEISPGLGRAAVAALLDGEVVDLRTAVDKDAELTALTTDDEGGMKAYRHTASHIMAQAVKRLYPEAKLAIGPAIDNGFYYDFDVEKPFSPEDLVKIEKEMKEIVKANYPIERFELPRNEAIELMDKKGESYKVELINDLPEDSIISFYSQDDFTDLCAGPHLLSTGAKKFQFKLLSIAGAYWRGSEDNKMLQRIYATCFEKTDDLDKYIQQIEEAKKRDHRKLGKELEIFTLLEQGAGFPFFLPNGMIIKNELINYWRQVHTEAGYVEISTPIILNRELWETSGHWSYYKENMYTTVIDEEDYAIKPMNCPGGMLAYKIKPHSYKELPIKMGELGLVHRHEMSGALHGLMRVRSFTQDDAHIFMLPEQIKDEIKNVIHLIDTIYKTFGFKYHLELSTRPEKSIGSLEDWETSTQALKDALDEEGLEYVINEGDGAFYGPKIDFHLEDCIGRTWQCGTIQLDFQLPERFELEYIGSDGQKHRPVMIHRVAYGSIERFIGILIEHFAGAFPVWLAPVQVKVLTITDRNNEYAEDVVKYLAKCGVRASIDDRSEKIGFKIREARNERVPYIAVIGDNEVENSNLNIRIRGQMDSVTMTKEQLSDKVKEDVATHCIF